MRLDPSTGKSFAFASGFTTITGPTFGPNGNLYVLDETTNGLGPNAGAAQLFQVDLSGVHTLLATLPGGTNYTSLIAGPGNALFISSQGAGAEGTGQGAGAEGTGQVLRYSLNAPVPEASPTVSFGLLLALGQGGRSPPSARSRAPSLLTALRPKRPSDCSEGRFSFLPRELAAEVLSIHFSILYPSQLGRLTNTAPPVREFLEVIRQH